MKVFELGSAALLFAVVPFLPTRGLTACSADSMLISTDCLSVEALEVESDTIGVPVGGVHMSVPDDPDCPPLNAASITYYRDNDGIPGFLSPPDDFVGHKAAHLDGTTGDLTIGSFSNESSQNGRADSWQVDVSTNSGQSRFSGDF